MPESEVDAVFDNALENPPTVPNHVINLAGRDVDLLSTGCTTLNLSLTDKPYAGLLKGYYYLWVGDSNSGKTILAMATLAEATINKNFDDYDLIYDMPERGMIMDTDRLFGERLTERLKAPRYAPDGAPMYSDTLDSFYYNLDDAVKSGRKFIYILDSMDPLEPVADAKKFEETKKAARKVEAKRLGRTDIATEDGDKPDKEPAGSYGTAKARENSQKLRSVMSKLNKSDSILIILTQTRDSIDKYKSPKTYSGGRALKFYATVQVWFSPSGAITKTVNERDRKIGNRMRAVTDKNRITGKHHTVEFDVYPSYGIDDIGTCIEYLLEEDYWTVEKGKQIITAKGLDIAGTKDKLIRVIEKRNLEDKVRGLCGTCWDEIQKACALPRKNRYTGQ